MEHLTYLIRQTAGAPETVGNGDQIVSCSTGLGIALANHQAELAKTWFGWTDRVQGGDQPLSGSFFDAKIRRAVSYRILRDQTGAPEAQAVIQTREEALGNGSVFGRMQELGFAGDSDFEEPDAGRELQAMERVLREHGDLLSRLIGVMASGSAFKRAYIYDAAENCEAWLNAIITLHCGADWTKYLLAVCDGNRLCAEALEREFGRQGAVYVCSGRCEGNAGEGECVLDAANHACYGVKGPEELEASARRLIGLIAGDVRNLTRARQLNWRLLVHEKTCRQEDVYALLRLLCGDDQTSEEQLRSACGILEQGWAAGEDDIEIRLMKNIMGHPRLSVHTIFRYLRALHGFLDETDRMTVMKQLAERMIDAAASGNAAMLEEYVRELDGLSAEAGRQLSLWLIHENSLARLTSCLNRFQPELLGRLIAMLLKAVDRACEDRLEDMFSMQTLKRLLVVMTDHLAADAQVLKTALCAHDTAYDVLVCYAMLYYWNREADSERVRAVWKAVLSAVSKLSGSARLAAFRLLCRQETDCAIRAAERILTEGSREGLLNCTESASLFMELLSGHGDGVGEEMIGDVMDRFGTEGEQSARQLLGEILVNLKRSQSIHLRRIIWTMVGDAQRSACRFILTGGEEKKACGLYRWMGEQGMDEMDEAISSVRLSDMLRQTGTLQESVRLMRLTMTYCHAVPGFQLAQYPSVLNLASHVFGQMAASDAPDGLNAGRMFSSDEMNVILCHYAGRTHQQDRQTACERAYRAVRRILKPAELLNVIFKMTLQSEPQIMLADRLLFHLARDGAAAMADMDDLCQNIWSDLRIRRLNIPFGNDYIGLRCRNAGGQLQRGELRLAEAAELIAESDRRDRAQLLLEVLHAWLNVTSPGTADECIEAANVIKSTGLCGEMRRIDTLWQFGMAERLLKTGAPDQWMAGLEALKERGILPIHMTEKRQGDMLYGMICGLRRRLTERAGHRALLDSHMMICVGVGVFATDSDLARMYARYVFDISARRDDERNKDGVALLCGLIEYAAGSDEYAGRVAAELRRAIRMEQDREFLKAVQTEVKRSNRPFQRNRWSKEQLAAINQWFE